MKLVAKLGFAEFKCPALGIELGAGIVMFSEKDNFGVAELNEPDIVWLIPSHAIYGMKLNLSHKQKFNRSGFSL